MEDFYFSPQLCKPLKNNESFRNADRIAPGKEIPHVISPRINYYFGFADIQSCETLIRIDNAPTYSTIFICKLRTQNYKKKEIGETCKLQVALICIMFSRIILHCFDLSCLKLSCMSRRTYDIIQHLGALTCEIASNWLDKKFT